jgi:L,D-peptidoglycan transpeptidase YkuD (ErfK/YbiS/YcfS/YnhG family)
MGRQLTARASGVWLAAVGCALCACTAGHPSASGSQAPVISSQSATAPPPSTAAGSVTTPASSSASAGASSLASAPSAAAIPTPSPTKTAAPSPSKTAAPPAPLLVEQLASVASAEQVVIVTSSGWSTDVATLQTFQKDAAGWHPVFPAMAAHIGRAGFSADKHEGDLKTPAGSFGFGTMFGQRATPGVKFPYRVADSQSVWVDDPSSAFYNTWQENAVLSGEHLAAAGFSTSYAYAIDIAYNTGPVVPGKGSAIFLHVTTGGGTAGCVSIAQSNLLEILRWLDPSRSPIIVMGPTSVIREY